MSYTMVSVLNINIICLQFQKKQYSFICKKICKENYFPFDFFFVEIFLVVFYLMIVKIINKFRLNNNFTFIQTQKKGNLGSLILPS
jgi:hypothetical protein